MSQWLYTLDLRNEWPLMEQGAIPLDQACMLVVSRLTSLPPSVRPGVQEALKDITELWTRACLKAPTTEEFDELLSALYDWGDTPINQFLKTCWIQTEHA